VEELLETFRKRGMYGQNDLENTGWILEGRKRENQQKQKKRRLKELEGRKWRGEDM